MTSPPPGSSGPVVAVAPRAQYPLLAETRAPLGAAAVPLALQRSLALVPHQQQHPHDQLHNQSQHHNQQQQYSAHTGHGGVGGGGNASGSGSGSAKGLAGPPVARVRLPQSPLIAAR
jgi:hypothetical protein